MKLVNPVIDRCAFGFFSSEKILEALLKAISEYGVDHTILRSADAFRCRRASGLSVTVESAAKALRVSNERIVYILRKAGYHNIPVGAPKESLGSIELDNQALNILKRENRIILKNYFNRSTAFYDALSEEDRRSFDEFRVKFSKKKKFARKWRDIDLSKIDKVFLREALASTDDQHEAIPVSLKDLRSMDAVRSSKYYRVKTKISGRRHREVVLRYLSEVLVIHRYYIFTSEQDSDSGIVFNKVFSLSIDV